MLGLALWLLIWSGLLWVGLLYVSPTSSIAQLLFPAPAPTATATPVPTETGTPIITASPTPTATQGTSVLVSIPVTETVPVIPSNTPSATNTVIDLPTITNTSVIITPTDTSKPSNTPTLTLSPAPTSTQSVTTPTIEITSTNDQSQLDEETIQAILEEGNAILLAAITETTDGNLEQLQTVWRGRALTKAENFVTDTNNRFSANTVIELEYLSPLNISPYSTERQVVVLIQENWRYQGTVRTYEEQFEFIYTLTQDDGEWVISDYTYRNLPTESP